MSKTVIIAEAGVNHNGSMQLARKMIVAAKNAGADYVKFQAVGHTENLIARNAVMADYQIRNTGIEESQLEMVKKLMFPLHEYAELAKICHAEGIGFVATPFDLESVDFLASLEMDFMKIPSGEITDKPYLQAVAATGLPIVMSTGMSTLADIEAALNVLYSGQLTTDKITLLHCNTEYPTPFADVNLRVMSTLKREFGTAVGYSDHTRGIEVPIAAAALGAAVIEKHFTLSRSLDGPDHAASLTPDELTAMITSVRNIEQALGTDTKHVTESERKNIRVARRSIVAAREINIGQTIASDDLKAKRPGTGISPMRIDEIIGTIATRHYNPDDLIEL